MRERGSRAESADILMRKRLAMTEQQMMTVMVKIRRGSR
jgi:hypothetical protein